MNALATVVLPLVRHGATFAAGYLVSKGLLPEGQSEVVVGVLLGTASIIFSLIDGQVKKSAIASAKKA